MVLVVDYSDPILSQILLWDLSARQPTGDLSCSNGSRV